ncbi:hypothetical protein C7M84_017165 [Penaeus vannamei]|uniref:Uncharacterized protein n=1 Tax=Penaeus vannamei TaxID=6689 RepID=A0A423SL20_PENVA|nr:hypothetical protein C7M84_017165 [Penaeus vannamei]
MASSCLERGRVCPESECHRVPSKQVTHGAQRMQWPCPLRPAATTASYNEREETALSRIFRRAQVNGPMQVYADYTTPAFCFPTESYRIPNPTRSSHGWDVFPKAPLAPSARDKPHCLKCCPQFPLTIIFRCNRHSLSTPLQLPPLISSRSQRAHAAVMATKYCPMRASADRRRVRKKIAIRTPKTRKEKAQPDRRPLRLPLAGAVRKGGQGQYVAFMMNLGIRKTDGDGARKGGGRGAGKCGRNVGKGRNDANLEIQERETIFPPTISRLRASFSPPPPPTILLPSAAPSFELPVLAVRAPMNDPISSNRISVIFPLPDGACQSHAYLSFPALAPEVPARITHMGLSRAWLDMAAPSCPSPAIAPPAPTDASSWIISRKPTRVKRKSRPPDSHVYTWYPRPTRLTPPATPLSPALPLFPDAMPTTCRLASRCARGLNAAL